MWEPTAPTADITSKLISLKYDNFQINRDGTKYLGHIRQLSLTDIRKYYI